MKGNILGKRRAWHENTLKISLAKLPWLAYALNSFKSGSCQARNSILALAGFSLISSHGSQTLTQKTFAVKAMQLPCVW